MDSFWPGPLTIVLPTAEGTANVTEVLSGPETADTTMAGTAAADTTMAGTAAADTTIGIRCPDHRWVRQLARQVGPIAATSANQHGMPPSVTAEEVVQAFSKTHETALETARSKSPEGSVPKMKPALIIDGGPSATAASTVVDCLSYPPKILREGPITQEQLDAALSL